MSATNDTDGDSGIIDSPLKLGAIFLTFLLLIKAYGAARFSLTSASALLSEAPATVALGVIVSYGYMALATTAGGLVIWLWRSAANDTDRISETQVLTTQKRLTGIGFLVITGALSPSYYLAGTLSLAVLLIAFFWPTHPQKGFPRLRHYGNISWIRLIRHNLVLYYASIVVIIFVVATIQQPWVPAEVLILKQSTLINPMGDVHARDPIAYVVSQDGEWTVALAADSRYVMRLPTSSISGRIICHHHGQAAGHTTLLETLLGRPYRSPNLACWRVRENLSNHTLAP